MNRTQSHVVQRFPVNMPQLRISEALRGILTKNPDIKTFSVERILSCIGHDRLETSLVMFSIPAIVRVPVPAGIVSLPTSAIGYRFISGQKQIRIPRAILRKSVSRRALAVAIGSVLPLLEAAEKVARPRWNWMTHPAARRAIGLFVILLAVAIAYPLVGFDPLHAASILVVALGMAEQDGLVVLVGVAVGLLSLALLVASGMSVRVLRSKASRWLRNVARRLSIEALSRFLRRVGYERLARLLSFRWSHLFLAWDPEQPVDNCSRQTAVDGRGHKPRAPADSNRVTASVNNSMAGKVAHACPSVAATIIVAA